MAASTSRLVIEISSEQAKRNAELLNRELQSIEKNGDFATKSMDAMSVATRSLAAQMTALVSVGALISKMDAYTNLQNRLKLVTNSQTELNKAMSDTFDIAQRTRQSWDAAAQVYQGFANNAKTLGLTMDQTAKLTETVSKAVAISGASAASAEAALVQFNQALGAGALRGEELNSVMEQTPALARAIAEGMGITIGQLRTVAATGAITSEALVKALEKASKSVDSLFAKTDPTIGQSFTMLNNEVSKFIGEAGKASGAASLTADSVKLLAENLDLVVSSLQVAGAYYVGTYIPAIYASVAAGAAKSKQLVEQTVTQYGLIQAEKAASAQEVVGLEAKLAATQATRVLLVEELKLELQRKKSQISAQGSINSELRMGLLRQQQAQINAELTATENALAAARTRSTAASSASLAIGGRLLGVLGGPVGLGLTVATLAGAYLLMRDNGLEANAMLNEQSKYAQKSTEELKSLDSAHKSVAKNDLAQKFKEQNEELDRQARLFANAIGEVAQYNNQMGNGAKVSADLYAIQAEVRSGSLSLSEALSRVNQIAMITPEQRAQMVSQIEQYDKLYGTVSENAKAQKALGVEVKVSGNAAQNASSQLDGQAKSFNKVEEAARAAKNALENYRSGALADIKEMSAKTTLLMNSSLSNNQIDYLMKALKALNYDPKLTGTDEAKQLFNLALQQAKLADTEDKIAESRKESTKQLQKQYEYTKAQQKLLAKANSDVSKSGLGAYAESKGIPASYIAGLYMQESKAGTDLKSHTGALGNWQTTSGYRKDNGISLSDNNDFLKVGKIVVDNIAKEFEKSGSLEQAILSHNVGAGGARQFMKNGTVAGDPERQKEVSEYFGKISKWARWSSGGKISNDQRFDFDDFLEKRRKNQEEINKMRDELASEDIQRLNAHNKKIADITKNFSGQERDKYIMQENQRYDASEALAKLQFESQVQGWRWIGEERIKNQATVDKAVIDATRSMTDQQKVLAKASIDDQAKYEIEAYRRTQELKLLEFRAMLYAQVGDAQKAAMESKAQATLNPNQLGNWQLQNQFTDSMSGAWDSWQSSQKSINQIGDNGQYLNDANTRHKMLLEAEQAYQDQLKAIRDKGASDEMLLIRSQHDNQLQLYSSLLSSASTTWGNMTQMVKDARGENSKTFKAMFLAQQTMAIAQQIINTELAAGATTAQTGIFGLPAATAIRAIGYASVGLIAAQTIASFSTGGHVRGSGTETSDSIPAMLSDNEYVIKAKSVRSLGVDTLDYINRMGELPVKRASGRSVGDTSSYIVDRYKSTTQPISDGGIQIAVSVNDSGVSTSGANTQDQKQLGQMIGNAVRAVIRQEQRQGGLLSK
ncbi:tape measure protein [Acinetobacter soli]|uniref:tape measure protein n=1 Tax=Acinetobacter soli TaxID=487316 RepID=UPI00287C6F0B|nr:tape measure protein [Acinetobacter soli]MDS7693908.1 tape measure protein [Acinetobacter soli]